MKKYNTRAIAATLLFEVCEQKKSLTPVLQTINAEEKDSQLIRQLCYGSLRFYYRLDAIAAQLINKPLKKTERVVYYLLVLGLYQLIYLRTPDHAAVTETVNAAKQLNKKWASGFLNACLRSFLRQQDALLRRVDENIGARYAHPDWFVGKLKKSWPDHWQAVLEANNQQAPLFLRVNQQKISREDFLEKLQQANIAANPWPHNDTAIRLDAYCDVTALPGFSQGLFSVQDPAAQFAAKLLQLKAGQRVLDACAAPGGKTCHILETETQLQHVTAIDQDEYRLTKVHENLNRLQLNADVECTSVEKFAKHSTEQFDRILLDAPCSASGVIRRHPDIKVLRQADDIQQLASTQLSLLKTLWPLLKTDGIFLYATCSVLPQENEKVIAKFVDEQKDCEAQPISISIGESCDFGHQLFPCDTLGNDGFYYAVLKKITQ